jgi:hypothetical protein
MKRIFFTVAALFVMSVTVFGKGEPAKDPAPTGMADKKRPSAMKVTFDDAAAEQKAREEVLYARATKTQNEISLHRVDADFPSVNYYRNMGEGYTQKNNLNYGSGIVLSPLQGAIR